MKNFPVLKNIGKEPNYFGLSLKSFMLLIIEIIITIIFTRGFITLLIFLPIILVTYFGLSAMEKKHGNDFLSKFLKKYFENFNGTKISITEIKEALKK
ncbi:hypothetical protein [Chryseobacterium oncorhynchi]|uniref:Uncharacterized protein n=1 Tax=Chryseobacterium oncorhynchi TaxID=741074 RepID=A0A316WDR4_9FLAO|nr:hypothetical protein [Chryseobacterium oncorhynchi]PWN59574.1 hypothetical protein C1638_021465 [Chryseobacterium oncorhynchi]